MFIRPADDLFRDTNGGDGINELSVPDTNTYQDGVITQVCMRASHPPPPTCICL
jgi:hypothetical protein